MHSTDPVNRLMTTPVMTVDIDEPAGELLRLLAGYPVHHLPVLDQGKVVGMLSSADVATLELLLPKGCKSPVEYLNQRMKVSRLVRRPALTVHPHQSVDIAAQMMVKHGVHALAVVNFQDQLVGIVTTTDIMHAALAAQGSPPALGMSAVTSDEARRIWLSQEQLDQALAAAAAQAGIDGDANFVNRGLIFLRARVAQLEQVRNIASRFLHAGQDQQLHSELQRAVEAVRRSDEAATAA